jgi:hypothetical protein
MVSLVHFIRLREAMAILCLSFDAGNVRVLTRDSLQAAVHCVPLRQLVQAGDGEDPEILFGKRR